MNNRINRGSVAELVFAAEAVKRGYTVSMPISHNCHYDILVDDGVSLAKVQVKRAYETKSHGKDVKACEGRRISGGKRYTYPAGSYDVLAAVDIVTNDIWLIPQAVALASKSQIYLKGKEQYRNVWLMF